VLHGEVRRERGEERTPPGARLRPEVEAFHHDSARLEEAERDSQVRKRLGAGGRGLGPVDRVVHRLGDESRVRIAGEIEFHGRCVRSCDDERELNL